LYVKQNDAPIPFGQSWIAPPEGLRLKGPGLPTKPAWPAYTATISGGKLTSPVTIEVPVHEWATRWRWQSAPRPISRTYSDLVAMKAVLPLDLQYRGASHPPPAHSWAGPMDTAGLEVGMGAPADRPEIGLITEHQAWYLITGDAGCKTTMLAQAEAVGSMPIWVRDADTGAIVDPGAHPYVAFADADKGRHYTIPKSPVDPVRAPTHFGMDEAHMPATAYVPYMLTLDSYFLEGMHALAAYGMMEANYRRLKEKLPRLAATGQPRGLAWNWRDIFRNARVTPEAPPSWLLSQAQWQESIADQIEFGNRYINAKQSPCTTVFKFFPQVNSTEAFMLDYLMLTIAEIKWSGQFPEMDPIIEYAATPRLVMSDPHNSKGWDHRYQMFYYGPVADARLGAKATGGPVTDYTIAASPNTPETWKELFDCLCQWAAVHANGWVDPAKLA
jgi:hypothetical protein